MAEFRYYTLTKIVFGLRQINPNAKCQKPLTFKHLQQLSVKKRRKIKEFRLMSNIHINFRFCSILNFNALGMGCYENILRSLFNKTLDNTIYANFTDNC